MYKIFISCCIATIFSIHGHSQGFQMFGGNPEHTGKPGTGNYSNFDQTMWKFSTGGKVFSSPVIFASFIFFGSEDHNVYALDKSSGKEIWRFSTGGPVHSTPLVIKGMVCFLSFDGNFYAVDLKTGKEKWRFKTEGEKWHGTTGLWGLLPQDLYMEDLFQYFLSSAVADPKSRNPTIYFGSGDSHLYALDAATGKLKWKFKTEGGIHTSPALHDGLVFVGGWDRNIYALDENTGKELWSFTTKRDDSGWGGMQGIQASPSVVDGKVLCGSRDGSFYALDEKTGAKVWEYATGGTWILGSSVVSNGKIYVGTSDTYKLLMLDLKSGNLMDSVVSNGYVYSTPALSGEYAFFGTYTGKIVCAKTTSPASISDEWQTPSGKDKSSQILKDNKINFEHLFVGLNAKNYEDNIKAVRKLEDLGPIVSTPLIQGNRIYFGSGDGNLYCVALKKK